MDASGKDGCTALVWAARNSLEATVQLLVERGANTEAEDKDGRTSLSHASENGDEHTVRILLAFNASIHAQDKMGKTALLWVLEKNGQHYAPFSHQATQLLHYQMQLMLLEQQNKKRLLMARAEQDQASQRIVGRQGQGQRRWTPVSDNRVEVIQLLLASGVQVDAAGDDGITALELAAERGWDNIVQLFRKQGAEIDGTQPESHLGLSITSCHRHI
jgi:ankyrin repeat protein